MSLKREVDWVIKLALFFFFQAEDGIRDVAVTGVQTCALPIWTLLAGCASWMQHSLQGFQRAISSSHSETYWLTATRHSIIVAFTASPQRAFPNCSQCLRGCSQRSRKRGGSGK